MVTFTALSYAEWKREAYKRPRNILRIEDMRAESFFVTEYAPACPIEKTVAHYATVDYTSPDEPSVPGRLEVYMRTGEVHSFEAWATWWCADYGINVSDDGERIYVISDLKGLRCHDREGRLLWKNRYTSITRVLPHSDGSVTALTYNGRVFKFDGKGSIVAKRQAFGDRQATLMSSNIVALCTGDYTVTFFDTETLEPIHKTPFRGLLENLECTAVSEKYILLVGKRAGAELRLPNGGRRWEKLPTVWLLDRRDNRVLRVFDHTFVEEHHMMDGGGDFLAPCAALDGEKIILYPGATDGVSFRRMEWEI